MGQTKTASASKSNTNPKVSRKRTYGGLVRLLLACTWTFFIGVLVGRGTAPIHFDMAELARHLDTLKDAARSRQTEALESDATAVEGKAERDVYETLKRADARLTIDPELARRVAEPANEAGGGPPPAATPVEETRIVRRQSGLQPKKSRRTQAVAAAPRTDRATPTSQENSGTLTLQVAAMQDLEMAQELTERLRRQGLEAYLVSTTLPGKGLWHRVRVGRFRDREAAASLLRRLEAQGMQPMVVPR